MKFLRTKRGLLAAGLLLLLGLYFIKPGAEWLRGRLVGAMRAALGRQVEVGSIHVRVLPRPGFDLEKVIVYDDPVFGAEPMLRSDEVTAAVRLTSLVRGRLEISRLNLSDPSVNLVRNAEGRWNVESLLERAAKTQAAPTGQAHGQARAEFPYIEADGGRINFKFKSEKTAYSLTDADFALWQDSDNQWGMRLKAQPMRTNFNLSDTGSLKVSGTWQRAASLRETPLEFTLLWDKAQLGQATKLVYGNDKGWRGGVRMGATLKGTPADLRVTAEASVQDFRRYDIPGGGSLKLAARCTAHYSTTDQTLSEIACSGPVSDGSVTLTGEIRGMLDARTYDLQLRTEKLQVQPLVALAKHMKKNLPEDLAAKGKLEAEFAIKGGGGDPIQWRGSGEATNVVLSSEATHDEVGVISIPFTVASGEVEHARNRNKRGAAVQDAPAGPRIEVGPFDPGVGKTAGASMQGWLARSGYSFEIEGDAQIQKTLQAARLIGLGALPAKAEGVAKLELELSGSWAGFAPPRATGRAQLRAVKAEVRGLNAPLEIASANLSLNAGESVLENLNATVGDTKWRGWVQVPRACVSVTECPAQFVLQAEELSTDDLSAVLSPRPVKRPWYRLLPARAEGTPPLLSLHASGTIAAARLLVRRVEATNVTAKVDLAEGKLKMTELRGDVLGGKHSGEWTADFTSKPAKYAGNGTVQGVQLQQVAEAMHDGWVTGTATGGYRAEFAGVTAEEMSASANGTLRLDARNVMLPHIALTEASGPLAARHMMARINFKGGRFEIQEGKLETTGSIYQISGTASLGRALDVKLIRDATHAFSITGTLTEPHVALTAIPETRAALKP